MTLTHLVDEPLTTGLILTIFGICQDKQLQNSAERFPEALNQ